MTKLTGGLFNNSNSIKDIDDKIAKSLERKGVVRIVDGTYLSEFVYYTTSPGVSNDWMSVRSCVF